MLIKDRDKFRLIMSHSCHDGYSLVPRTTDLSSIRLYRPTVEGALCTSVNRVNDCFIYSDFV